MGVDARMRGFESRNGWRAEASREERREASQDEAGSDGASGAVAFPQSSEKERGAVLVLLTGPVGRRLGLRG